MKPNIIPNIAGIVLGPIIITIMAFHSFVIGPKDLLNPMLDVIIVCALYLLWVGRKQFAGLLNCGQSEGVTHAH